MVQNTVAGSVNKTRQGGGRGRSKPFPPKSFEASLIFAETINTQGVEPSIRRLTLLDLIGISPGSSSTRQLISSSKKYGLTTGSYKTDLINLTERGATLFEKGASHRDIKKWQLELAIVRVEPFDKVYRRLEGNKLPNKAILNDMFGEAGVESSDRSRATKIFQENLRHIGLIKQMNGGEYVLNLDDISHEEQEREEEDSLPQPTESPIEQVKDHRDKGNGAIATNRPALHIDLQVHIDPSSSPEQIDQIFASTGRHLYGSES